MFDQTTVTDLPPMRYEPVSRRQLGVYARRLRRADRALTRTQALTRAEAHEASRAAAYAADDVTLVQSDPDGGA